MLICLVRCLCWCPSHTFCGDLKPIRSAPFTFERLPGIIKKDMLQCELTIKGPSLLLKNMCLLCLSQYITSPPKKHSKQFPKCSPKHVHPKRNPTPKISTNIPQQKKHSQKKNNTKHKTHTTKKITHQPQRTSHRRCFFKRNQQKKR